MHRNFERSLSLVLQSEGGFSDNPKDPGGATNHGITLTTYRRYVDPKAYVEQLKRISDSEVAAIYRAEYWNRINGDGLPDGIDYAVFDFAVNSGPERAAKYLQTVVGAKVDGAIGPATIMACQNRNSRKVVEELCARRLSFLHHLSTWGEFGRGWAARVESVQSEAVDMMGAAYAAQVAAYPGAGAPPQPPLDHVPVDPKTAPQGVVARLKRFFA